MSGMGLLTPEPDLATVEPPVPEPDLAVMQQTLDLLHEPDDVVELRAPVFPIYGEDWEFVFTEIRKAGYRRLVVDGRSIDISQPVEDKVGELQRFTPTIEALAVPDIDSSLDEAPAKTAFWNAFKTVGPWWAALPPY